MRPVPARQRLGLVLRAALGLSALLSVVMGSWSLVHWIFLAAPGWPGAGNPWLQGALETALAVLLAAFLMGVLSRLYLTRHRHDVFGNLIAAMGRIARGDFAASLELEGHEGDGPMAAVAAGLNEMAESLGHIEAMRREFISDVSHEIQSPLTSIAGFSRALRSRDLGEEERLHYLDIIEAESLRLSRLGEGLLRLSSLEAGAIPLDPSSYRLDTQLRDIVLGFEPQWKEKGLDVGATLPVLHVRADRAMLGQVWTNLLHNAVKFTPAGGKIEIEATEMDGMARVRISDTGRGIAAGELGRVFDRFYKADPSRNPGEGGSGLGLAIARRIVLLHGGRIEAASEGPGRGACFTVELALAPP